MAAVDVVSAALLKIGEQPITSLSGTDTKSVNCSSLWTAFRDDFLRSHHWNFATKRIKLAPSVTEPAFEWDYQFRLPSDFLRIVSVSDNDAGSGTVPYKMELSEDDTVEGTFTEPNSGTLTVGDGVTNGKNFALKFTNERAGVVSKMQLDVANVNTAFSALAKIYSNSSGSPGTQVGGNSTAVTLAQGVNEFTWSASAPVLDADTVYWAVFTDNTATTGDVDLRASASDSNFGSGLHDTITSITDSLSTEYRIAIHVSHGGQARFILSDADELYLRYIAQITDTDLWSADAREAASWGLAVQFAMAFSQAPSVMERMAEAFKSANRRARSSDAIEDFPESFPEGSWVTSRYRSWPT